MATRKRNQAATSTVSRKQLRESERAARQRQKRLKTVAWASAVTALVALVVVWAVIRAANQPGQVVPDQGNLHIEPGQTSPIAYNSVPPTSGAHYESIANWGIHTELIPNELQVHNLEDGGVGVWYDCPDGCPELVSQLEAVVRGYDEGVLLAPYPGLDSRIALTAWTRIDKFDEFDRERIVRFIKAYRGRDHHVSR